MASSPHGSRSWGPRHSSRPSRWSSWVPRARARRTMRWRHLRAEAGAWRDRGGLDASRPTDVARLIRSVDPKPGSATAGPVGTGQALWRTGARRGGSRRGTAIRRPPGGAGHRARHRRRGHVGRVWHWRGPGRPGPARGPPAHECRGLGPRPRYRRGDSASARDVAARRARGHQRRGHRSRAIFSIGR